MTPTGTLAIVHSFSASDGANPGTLIQGADLNFYGTTTNGGANADGEVFELTSSGVLTILHSFDVSDGANPGPLVQGKDGNFYGGAVKAGSGGGYGTAYKLVP